MCTNLFLIHQSHCTPIHSGSTNASVHSSIPGPPKRLYTHPWSTKITVHSSIPGPPKSLYAHPFLVHQSRCSTPTHCFPDACIRPQQPSVEGSRGTAKRSLPVVLVSRRRSLKAHKTNRHSFQPAADGDWQQTFRTEWSEMNSLQQWWFGELFVTPCLPSHHNPPLPTPLNPLLPARSPEQDLVIWRPLCSPCFPPSFLKAMFGDLETSFEVPVLPFLSQSNTW